MTQEDLIELRNFIKRVVPLNEVAEEAGWYDEREKRCAADPVFANSDLFVYRILTNQEQQDARRLIRKLTQEIEGKQ